MGESESERGRCFVLRGLEGGNDVSIWRNEKTRYMLLLSFVSVLCGVSFTSVERGGKGAPSEKSTQ